jgi:parallel beta-helix repeat protein
VNSPGGTNDGTAVLCDGTSPTIEKCTFSGTAHAGITTLGTAHPRISDKNFAGNLNWGITVYGESYPTISKNTFSTLNGIDCTASSHPSIENNKISCGSAGISTKGSANPTITDNTLNGNVIMVSLSGWIQHRPYRGTPLNKIRLVFTSQPEVPHGLILVEEEEVPEEISSRIIHSMILKTGIQWI